MTAQIDAQTPASARRKFNIFLAIGIFLLPIVFVWFLLRSGHSTTARIVGFGWTVLFLLIAASGSSTTGAARQEARPAEVAAPLSEEERAAIAERAARESAERELRAIQRSPERYLELEDANGVRGGFDTVFMLSGRIRNSSAVDIKDPQIVCALFGASGTQVGEVRQILYEIVPANDAKRFSELNMGFMGSTQVASYRCEITDADAAPTN